MALCPHCQKPVTEVTVEDVPINAAPMGTFKGVAVSCKNCNTLLSMGLDPLFYGGQLVEAIAKAVKK
jgi:hypothetical protein